MLRDLMEKEDNMQVHIENMSREMEILRKTKKKHHNRSKTLIKMKNALRWTQ